MTEGVWYTTVSMEGKNISPRAFMILGVPCSGKTTFAEKFSKRFKTPYYDLCDICDEFNVPINGALRIIELIAGTKKDIVVEGELEDKNTRVKLRNLLKRAGYQPILVWIQTDDFTIRARLRQRLGSISRAKQEYEARIMHFEAPSEMERPIVLSGKHTFETQLKHILSSLAK